jgi:hypothetical protein
LFGSFLELCGMAGCVNGDELSLSLIQQALTLPFGRTHELSPASNL